MVGAVVGARQIGSEVLSRGAEKRWVAIGDAAPRTGVADALWCVVLASRPESGPPAAPAPARAAPPPPIPLFSLTLRSTMATVGTPTSRAART